MSSHKTLSNGLAKYSLVPSNNGLFTDGSGKEQYRASNTTLFWESYCESVSEGKKINIGEVVGDDNYVLFFLVKTAKPYEVLATIRSAIEATIIVKKSDLYAAIFTSDGNFFYQFPFLKVKRRVRQAIKSKIENVKLLNEPKVVPLYGNSAISFEGFYDKHNSKVNETIVCEYFSPSHHPDLLLNPSGILSDASCNYTLPILLSIRYGEVKKSRIEVEMDGPIREGTPEFVERLINIIPISEMVSFSVFRDVGEVYHSTFKGQNEGLERWTALSERILEYIDQEGDNISNKHYPTVATILNGHNPLENQYKRMKSIVTSKTLGHYARKFNPKEYKKFHDEWVDYYYQAALSLIDRDVAKLIYVLCWLDFVSCDSRDTWWYYDRNTNRLVHTPKGNKLKKYINEEFLYFLRGKRSVYAAAKASCENTKTASAYEASYEATLALENYCGTGNKKNVLLGELDICFNDEKFYKYLDRNPKLTVFKNVVFECIDWVESVEKGVEKYNGFIVAREGKIEDYKSKGSMLIYDFSLHKHSPSVLVVKKWLKQVYSNPDLRSYVRKYFSSILMGGNDDKHLHGFIGKGNNSKSMILLMLKEVLQEDCVNIPAGAFSSKKRGNAGSATPEINRAFDAKFAAVVELGPYDFIDGQEIKSWTGNDNKYRRRMYSEAEESVPLSKLAFFANIMPPFSGGIDAALIDRPVIIPHTGRWKTNAPESEKEQLLRREFPLDRRFSKKIPEMAPAFLFLMRKKYSKYVKEGLELKPNIAKIATDNYWIEADSYANFISEYFQAVRNDDGEPDMESVIKVSKAYSEFQLYWDKTKPGKNPPTLNTFKTEISKRIGSVYNNKWYGAELVKQHSVDGQMPKAVVVKKYDSLICDIFGEQTLLYESR